MTTIVIIIHDHRHHHHHHDHLLNPTTINNYTYKKNHPKHSLEERQVESRHFSHSAARYRPTADPPRHTHPTVVAVNRPHVLPHIVRVAEALVAVRAFRHNPVGVAHAVLDVLVPVLVGLGHLPAERTQLRVQLHEALGIFAPHHVVELHAWLVAGAAAADVVLRSHGQRQLPHLFAWRRRRDRELLRHQRHRQLKVVGAVVAAVVAVVVDVVLDDAGVVGLLLLDADLVEQVGLAGCGCRDCCRCCCLAIQLRLDFQRLHELAEARHLVLVQLHAAAVDVLHEVGQLRLRDVAQHDGRVLVGNEGENVLKRVSAKKFLWDKSKADTNLEV
jgi:hypothetical protein